MFTLELQSKGASDMKAKLQQKVAVIVVGSVGCREYAERRRQIKLKGSKKAFFS